MLPSSSSPPKLVPNPELVVPLLTRQKETRDKAKDKAINYYSRNRISACVTMIITIMILVLLMVPIWLLYKLSVNGTIATSPQTIGVILVPTLIFSAVLSAFTKAKRHEILAASAGYTPILSSSLLKHPFF